VPERAPFGIGCLPTECPILGARRHLLPWTRLVRRAVGGPVSAYLSRIHRHWRVNASILARASVCSYST
jgi:hypothetical protein